MAVELSAPKTRKAKASGDIESLEIIPSENGGFSVRCRKAAPKGKGNVVSSWVEPETYVYSNLRQLKTFLDDTFG